MSAVCPVFHGGSLRPRTGLAAGDRLQEPLAAPRGARGQGTEPPGRLPSILAAGWRDLSHLPNVLGGVTKCQELGARKSIFLASLSSLQSGPGHPGSVLPWPPLGAFPLDCAVGGGGERCMTHLPRIVCTSEGCVCPFGGSGAAPDAGRGAQTTARCPAAFGVQSQRATCPWHLPHSRLCAAVCCSLDVTPVHPHWNPRWLPQCHRSERGLQRAGETLRFVTSGLPVRSRGATCWPGCPHPLTASISPQTRWAARSRRSARRSAATRPAAPTSHTPNSCWKSCPRVPSPPSNGAPGRGALAGPRPSGAKIGGEATGSGGGAEPQSCLGAGLAPPPPSRPRGRGSRGRGEGGGG